MDADYIKQHDVINRYVLHQLTEEELVAFEMYFLEHPEVLDEVAEVEAMKAGLESHRTALVQQADDRTGFSLADLIASWFRNPAIQFANFAALAILLSLQLSNTEPTTLGGFSAERFWLGEVRGGEDATAVHIRTASILFDIDVIGTGEFEVTLLDSGDKVVSRVSRLRPEDDVLLVVFNSSLFTDGRYRLNVATADGTTVLQKNLDVTVSE